jgi:large subunit ribosomal protein L15
MPLQRRLPKYGFNNVNRVSYKAINLDTIQALASAKNLDKVSVDDLRAAHLVGKKQLVKVLGKGEITAKLTVEANAFSKTAEEAITKAGGSVVKL